MLPGIQSHCRTSDRPLSNQAPRQDAAHFSRAFGDGHAPSRCPHLRGKKLGKKWWGERPACNAIADAVRSRRRWRREGWSAATNDPCRYAAPLVSIVLTGLAVTQNATRRD